VNVRPLFVASGAATGTDSAKRAEVAADTRSVHTPTMTLKNAALMALKNYDSVFAAPLP
jgi:hypothetical protein